MFYKAFSSLRKLFFSFFSLASFFFLFLFLFSSLFSPLFPLFSLFPPFLGSSWEAKASATSPVSVASTVTTTPSPSLPKPFPRGNTKNIKRKPDFTQPEGFTHLLRSLPDQSLSFDLIMTLALMSTHANLIHIEEIREKVPLWEMEGALDWQMNLGTEFFDFQQKRDAQNFDFKGQSFSGGLSKPFLTGTHVSLNYHLSQKDPKNIGAGAAFLDPKADWNVHSLSLNVRQPLLKNAFGKETRHQWLAAKKAHQLQKLLREQRLEELHATFLKSYYGGWQAQRQVEFEKKQVQRQRRLLKVVEKQFRLGTATEDSLLQMRSGLLQAENALTQSQVQLRIFWHSLIIGLHLPLHWTEKVNPLWVPMKIEQRGKPALTTCQRILHRLQQNTKSLPSQNPPNPSSSSSPSPSFSSLLPQDTSSQLLETQLQVHQSQLKVMQTRFWPDLSLGLSWNQNLFNLDLNQDTESTGDNIGKSFFAEKDEKEEWRISLQFRMPFFHGREKSQLAQAHFSSLESQLQKQQYEERKLILWKNQCKILNELFAVRARLKKSYQQSQKMAKLREELFHLGKKDAFQMIQSLREVSQQHFSLQKNRVDIQKVAWEILRLQGKILTYLNKLKLPPSLKTYVKRYKESMEALKGR